jgi:hypothetical protein
MEEKKEKVSAQGRHVEQTISPRRGPPFLLCSLSLCVSVR